MISENELDLVKRVQKGDKHAKEELYHCFEKRLRFVIRRRLALNEEDLHDLSQVIFIAIFESFEKGKFDAKKAKTLASWVYGITNNQLKEYFKKQKKSNREIGIESIGDMAHHDKSPQDLLEDRELAENLRRTISKLKIKYQEVLYLRYYENLSLEEISQRINCNRQQAENRLDYARKKLKQQLENIDNFQYLAVIV